MIKLLIPNELNKRLEALAAKAHIPKDKYIVRALEEFLEDQEDYLDALEISLRIEKGEEKTIPYEEVLKRYQNDRLPH